MCDSTAPWYHALNWHHIRVISCMMLIIYQMIYCLITCDAMCDITEWYHYCVISYTKICDNTCEITCDLTFISFFWALLVQGCRPLLQAAVWLLVLDTDCSEDIFTPRWGCPAPRREGGGGSTSSSGAWCTHAQGLARLLCCAPPVAVGGCGS